MLSLLFLLAQDFSFFFFPQPGNLFLLSFNAEICLIKQRQPLPTERSTNQPSGCKCCCLHMASTPRGKTGRGKLARQRQRGDYGEPETTAEEATDIPQSPLIPVLSQIVASASCCYGLAVEYRQEASESCGPRSESATLDGVFVPWGSQRLSLCLGYFVR